MTRPVALMFYERLLPGPQLGQRLEDLGYDVRTFSQAEPLLSYLKSSAPFVLLIDLELQRADATDLIRSIRQIDLCCQVPILAFCPKTDNVQSAATNAGATIITRDSALLAHLPQLLEQVLGLR